ncbi:MAG: hypothetical protein AAF639_00500 [Chloroflexota bacterium]
MYEFMYPRTHKLKAHQFQTYIVSSKTPQKARLKKWGYKVSDYPGVYTSKIEAYEDIVLIVPNKLRKLPHNSYFQLFASEKKVREWAFEHVLRTHASGLSTDQGVSYILTVVFALAKAYELELKELQEDQMDVERLLAIGAEYRENFIAAATLEERLAGLKPEERMMGLRPEELLAMFKPEERLMGLRPEEVFRMFKPEERLMGLRPEERLMGLRPEERLVGLRPEEVLGMFKPEERLTGLRPEEKRLLLKELQESLLADEEEATAELNADESNAETRNIDTLKTNNTEDDLPSDEGTLASVTFQGLRSNIEP